MAEAFENSMKTAGTDTMHHAYKLNAAILTKLQNSGSNYEYYPFQSMSL